MPDQGRILRPIAASLFALSLSACSASPPVQEMSDARQAVQAARDASAQTFAPDHMGQAEALLDEAARAIESGRYAQAREQALAARRSAIRARSFAIDTDRKR